MSAGASPVSSSRKRPSQSTGEPGAQRHLVLDRLRLAADQHRVRATAECGSRRGCGRWRGRPGAARAAGRGAPHAAGSRDRRRSSRCPGPRGAGSRTAPLPGHREPAVTKPAGSMRAWRASQEAARRSFSARTPGLLRCRAGRGAARPARRSTAQPAARERRREVARILEPRLPRRLQGRQQARLRHVEAAGAAGAIR